jgi:hypothetical protein
MDTVSPEKSDSLSRYLAKLGSIVSTGMVQGAELALTARQKEQPCPRVASLRRAAVSVKTTGDGDRQFAQNANSR